jgi:four helix bundle protein
MKSEKFMVFKKFEEIIAWQKAQDLAVNIYNVFLNNKDIAFKSQICRAAVSISNNIAEGFDRSSNADFIRFLFISFSSCSEVRSMLYLAYRLKYITENEQNDLQIKANEVSKIIWGLIKSLKNKPQTTNH